MPKSPAKQADPLVWDCPPALYASLMQALEGRTHPDLFPAYCQHHTTLRVPGFSSDITLAHVAGQPHLRCPNFYAVVPKLDILLPQHESLGKADLDRMLFTFNDVASLYAASAHLRAPIPQGAGAVLVKHRWLLRAGILDYLPDDDTLTLTPLHMLSPNAQQAGEDTIELHLNILLRKLKGPEPEAPSPPPLRVDDLNLL